jgi:hypothetical protein
MGGAESLKLSRLHSKATSVPDPSWKPREGGHGSPSRRSHEDDDDQGGFYRPEGESKSDSTGILNGEHCHQDRQNEGKNQCRLYHGPSSLCTLTQTPIGWQAQEDIVASWSDLLQDSWRLLLAG